jgi:hypothetical protein
VKSGARFDGDEAVAGLAWTADSRALVFGTGSALWMLPVPDFTSTAVDKVSMIDTRRVSWATIARHSGRLAVDIWLRRRRGHLANAHSSAK